MMKRKKRIRFGISAVLMMIIIVACQLARLPGITDSEDTATVTESDPLVEPEDADEILLPADSAAPISEPTFETMVNPVDGAEMVRVPAGTFWMGSNDMPEYTMAFEPERQLYLDEFWIYQVPVTNAQFSAFVAATGFTTHAEEWGWSWAAENENYNFASWQAPEGPGSDTSGREDHPVVHVNQGDAAAYCEWAGGRLPSEAEWEKAARGADGNQYPWGNEPPTCQKANLHSCVGGITPVGSYLQGISPYGALDMAGNVLEWTLDLFDPPPLVYVVQRGGSYEDEQPLSFLRYRGDSFMTAYHYGFRCRYPDNDGSLEPVPVEETTFLDYESGTWQLVTDNAEFPGRFRHATVVLPDGSIVLMGGVIARWEGRVNDVWRSTDGGVTWTQMTSSAPWSGRTGHQCVALPDGSMVLMGGFDDDLNHKNDVWRSTDQGASWSLMTDSAPWPPQSGHTSVVLSDGSIILIENTKVNHAVWRSNDQGATWSQVLADAPWTGESAHTSVVLPDGSIVIMFGDVGDVWRSIDQGATWIQMTERAAWTPRGRPASAALPDGSILMMGGTGYNIVSSDVWRSTDQGATWTLLTESAGWSDRWGHTLVVLSDGSVILFSGYAELSIEMNDVWQFRPANARGD